MLSILQIRLLGDFQLLHQGELVMGLHQTRLQSMLAYLLMHRLAPQSRRHLAFLLWPDSTEAQARTNLRRELHHLRHALPQADQFLIVGTQTVQWRTDAPYTLDIADFERSLAHAQDAKLAGQLEMVCSLLAQAVDLYRGDLLPSCYDEWILGDREQLRQQYISTLERLAQLLEDLSRYGDAIQMSERLLRHDPIHEASYQRLMRLHVLNRDRAHALRVYHLCVAALRRELDVEPSKETHTLYEQLLDGEITSHPVTSQSRTLPAQTTVVERPLLVARQAEWHTLQDAWHTASEHKIHFVLITGEAGIGKTRLAEELLVWAGQHAIPTARSRSYAAEGRLAYAPVAEWLRSDAVRGIQLPLGDTWLCEVARLLPEVIEDRPALAQPGPLAESWQRLRFFEGLARAVLISSQPLILLIDDLQWCDQDTLEWLRYLMHFAQGAVGQPRNRERILIIGTARSEEIGAQRPLWNLALELRNSGQLTEIEVAPLNQAETSELARTVAGHALNPAQMAQLYRDTEGNPLFIVETLRSRGNASPPLGQDRLSPASADLSTKMREQDGLVLPPKIYAVIHSRLAQLSPSARELAALAATIGRAFGFAVLASASGVDENVLVQGLDELWQRRIVREHGSNEYDFSHDRIRDVAYAESSPVRRRLLHRRVAEALEVVYSTDLDAVSGQIAAHYTQAALPEPAVHHFERAAVVAQRIYAHADAVVYLKKALALLAQLAKTPERLRQELRLQLDLGVSVGTLRGFANSEVKAIYERAQALADQVGDDEQQLMVISGLFSNYIWRGELQMAQKLAEQGIPLAQRMSDPVWLAEAHGRLGVVLYQHGEWQASRLCSEKAVAIKEHPRRSGARVEAAAQNPVVLHRRFLANTLWHLGYPDQALAQMHLALTHAQELAHPYTLAQSFVGVAGLYFSLRDIQGVQTYADKAIALSQEHGFPSVLDGCRFFVGWVLVQQGQFEAGIAQIRCALDAIVISTHIINLSTWLALLAGAYVSARKPVEGLQSVDQALAQIEATGQRAFLAELHRLKGELLQIGGASLAEVESYFVQSLTVARQQKAKSLELSAAISLSRLWQRQGRSSEAHKLLSGIYAWFTEGFDTPDLVDARALLAKLL